MRGGAWQAITRGSVTRGGEATRRGGVAILRAGFCAIGVNGSGQNYEDIYAFHSPSEHPLLNHH